MNGSDPTMVEVTAANQGNVRFSNSAFWGPCNQIAKINGNGNVSFSDCIFVEWDKVATGRSAIQVNGGSVSVRGCDFMHDSPQVKIEKAVERAIVTENTIEGKVRIENNAKRSYINGNLGTEE